MICLAPRKAAPKPQARTAWAPALLCLLLLVSACGADWSPFRLGLAVDRSEASDGGEEAIVPRPPAGQPIGALTGNRFAAIAVELSSGQILVAGGAFFDEALGYGEATDSCELFDPQTGTSTPTAPLHYVRSGAFARRQADGRVIVVGGGWFPQPDGGSTALPNELFDPATGAWTEVPVDEPSRTYGMVPVPLQNGCVLFAGGGIPYPPGGLSAETHLWCPETGYQPIDPLPFPWTDFAGVGLRDGTALLGGGRSNDPVLIPTALRFDPSQPSGAQWAAAPAMHTPRYAHVAAALPDGRALFTGGGDWDGMPIHSSEIFDPVTNSWTTTHIAAGHEFSLALPVGDGRIFIVGGLHGGYVVTDELFRSATSAFESASVAPTLCDSTAVKLSDGSFLLVGGAECGVFPPRGQSNVFRFVP